MTNSEVLDALALLEADNVSSICAAFICYPTEYATLASTVVDAGSGLRVVENDAIFGRRIIQSTLCTAGTDYLGPFRECVVQYRGVDLVVNNYSEARSATG